jgi:glycosyltransferase involved in cell wall biosynthesis
VSQPAITAMMLVRDRADLLEAAADSVLAQTDGDFELVILDDASVDATWQVAESIARRDGRVRLLRNSESNGIPAARNQVLAAARGRYLAICDSDDLNRPERFARERALLDARPELTAVGARISAFTDDPATGTEPDWHWGLRDGRLPFAFPTAMLRVDAVRDVGGFDEGMLIAEDLYLMYRLAGRRARFELIDEVLVDYRIHAGSITTSRSFLRRWCTLLAQLRGLVALRGGFTPRGYAVLVQSVLRLLFSRA